jgi:guanylate kinase
MINTVVVLCGKSATGKDTLASIINKMGYNFIASTTTRPMRDGETQGNPYFFTNNENFEKMIINNNFLEYRKYYPDGESSGDVWYYGVEKKQVATNEKYVVVLDIEGLKDFKKIFKSRIISFYIYADDEIRESRAIERGSFDKKEWNRRLKADSIDFSENKVSKVVDFKVENKSIQGCFEFIRSKIIRPSVEEMEL